jgi:hypothetical protein
MVDFLLVLKHLFEFIITSDRLSVSSTDLCSVDCRVFFVESCNEGALLLRDFFLLLRTEKAFALGLVIVL